MHRECIYETASINPCFCGKLHFNHGCNPLLITAILLAPIDFNSSCSLDICFCQEYTPQRILYLFVQMLQTLIQFPGERTGS